MLQQSDPPPGYGESVQSGQLVKSPPPYCECTIHRKRASDAALARSVRAKRSALSPTDSLRIMAQEANPTSQGETFVSRGEALIRFKNAAHKSSSSCSSATAANSPVTDLTSVLVAAPSDATLRPPSSLPPAYENIDTVPRLPVSRAEAHFVARRAQADAQEIAYADWLAIRPPSQFKVGHSVERLDWSFIVPQSWYA